MKYTKHDAITTEAIGESVANFIKGLSTVEARIGQMEKDSSNRKIIVIGKIIMEREEDNGTILRVYNDTQLPQVEVFSYESKVNMAAFFKKSTTYTNEEKKELRTKLDKILSLTELIVPFRIKSRIKADKYNDDKTKCTQTCEIFKIEIKLDSKKNEYIGTVHSWNADTENIITKEFKQYCNEFKLCDVEILNVKLDGHEKCIEMTGYGYVKPIEFRLKKDKRQTKSASNRDEAVVIDNTHIYSVSNNVIKKVCTVKDYINNGECAITNEVTDKKILKAIKANIGYIRKHCRLIAAVGMCENNVVEI